MRAAREQYISFPTAYMDLACQHAVTFENCILFLLTYRFLIRHRCLLI